jgi:hypothetical protein
MFLTKLTRTGHGIARRMLLVALSALLLVGSLTIVPNAAFGDSGQSQSTDKTSLENRAQKV